MPYPDKPDISTSYTAYEQSLGDGSLPGEELDVDLLALRDAVNEIVDFLRLFTRSDGKLANGIVTSESLSSSLRIGFDPPEPWVTGEEYTTSSTVFEGYGFYLCLTAHTAGADFTTDLNAGRWLLLADLTPPAGSLIANQNLADLADAATARTNLGLGTMATKAAGTSGTQFRDNDANDARFQPLAAFLTALATAGSVGTAQLADDAVTVAKLADDSVTADQLATDAVVTAGIIDGAVTFAKLAGAAVVTSSETIESNDNDTTVPTSAAVVDYVGRDWELVDQRDPATGASSMAVTITAGYQYRVEGRELSKTDTSGQVVSWAGGSSFTIPFGVAATDYFFRLEFVRRTTLQKVFVVDAVYGTNPSANAWSTGTRAAFVFGESSSNPGTPDVSGPSTLTLFFTNYDAGSIHVYRRKAT